MTLEEEIRYVDSLRETAEKTAEVAAGAKSDYDQAHMKLWERMEHQGITNVAIDGKNHIRKATIFGSVSDKSEFRRWAVDEGNAPELFEGQPRKALVSELVRQRLDNNEELPPGINWYVRKYVGR